MSPRRPLRRVLAGMLVTGAVATGCGGGHTTGPDELSITELQERDYFYQGEHLGQTVTVDATVSEVRGPRTVELSKPDFRGDSLIVVSDRPVEVEPGRRVRVTGAVGQLHETSPAEAVPYIQRGLYPAYETVAYLYHADVEPLAR